MATFLTTALHRSRVESNFGAQSTCIMSLRSQFWTFFEPTDPDLMQKCRGNVLTLPLLCLDMHSMLFWPIGGPFSKKKMHEIHVLQNTEIQFENTRNTKKGTARYDLGSYPNTVAEFQYQYRKCTDLQFPFAHHLQQSDVWKAFH